jgi:hypothetical protein
VVRRAVAADSLEQGFVKPPKRALRALVVAQRRCHQAAITAIGGDEAKGFGGALICDADGSSRIE